MPTRPKNFRTTMVLPTGAKTAWSSIMYGETPLPASLSPGDIIVAAWAKFRNGVQVIGGVRKSDSPDYNIKFFTVLDAAGQAYPNWPIDVSDHEDFHSHGFQFHLNEDESITYHLRLVEKAAG